MPKKKKRIFAVLLSAILVVALTGCSKLGSIINEIHGSLIGNNYTLERKSALPEIKLKPSAMTAMEEQ